MDGASQSNSSAQEPSANDNEPNTAGSVEMQGLSLELRTMATQYGICLRFLERQCSLGGRCKFQHISLQLLQRWYNEKNERNEVASVVSSSYSSMGVKSSPEQQIAKFKRGHIVSSNDGKKGTIWSNPTPNEHRKFVYKVNIRSGEDDIFREYHEEQLMFFHMVIRGSNEFSLFQGDLIKHRRYGFAIMQERGIAKQSHRINGQFSPGDVNFLATSENSEIIEAGPLRASMINDLMIQELSIEVIENVIKLIDDRCMPKEDHLLVLSVANFLRYTNLNSGKKQILSNCISARRAGEEAFKIEALRSINLIANDTENEFESELSDQDQIIEDVDSIADAPTNTLQVTAANQPVVTEVISTKTFDTEKFKNYQEVADELVIPLKKKMDLELGNLQMIGLSLRLGVITLPREGIPVSKNLNHRLSYISYSTLDILSAMRTGAKGKGNRANIRELAIIKNPPHLASRKIQDVRKFCESRDRYLSELARLFDDNGEMFEPADLLMSCDSRLRDWLSSQYGIGFGDLNVLHIDAFLRCACKFDPFGTDKGTEVKDVIAKLKIDYEEGESLKDYVHDLVARVKRQIQTLDVLHILNKSAKVTTDVVYAVCRHLPQPYRKHYYDMYQAAISSKNHRMYKNLFAFLEVLLKNVSDDILIPRSSFGRYEHSKRHYPGVNATKADVNGQSDHDESEESSTTSDTEEEDLSAIITIAFQAVAGKDQTCWGCNQSGHTIRACPKPLSIEQRKEIAKKKLKSLTKQTRKMLGGIKKKYPKGMLTEKVKNVAKTHINSVLINVGRKNEENRTNSEEESSESDCANEKLEGVANHIYSFNIKGRKTVAARENSKEENDDSWVKNIPVDKVIGRRKAAIFPSNETTAGLAVRIETKYLGDCGCLGLNLGGSELLDEIKKRKLPFEYKRLPDSVPIFCAWDDSIKITHIVRVTIACSTVHEIPLVERNVFIHLANKPLHTIFLGTRFCRQVGLKTVNQQIDEEAKRRAGLTSRAINAFSEDVESIKNALKDFQLEKLDSVTNESDNFAHCAAVVSKCENDDFSWEDSRTDFYLNLCETAVNADEQWLKQCMS